MACVCGGFLALPLTVAVDATVAGVTVRIWYAPQSLVLDRFEVPAQDLVVSLTSRTASVAALPKRGVYL